MTDIDRRDFDPFAPHDEAPPTPSDDGLTARWLRAGATDDEAAAMADAFAALTPKLQQAETDRVQTVADGVLAVRLEEFRADGSTGGLTFVAAAKAKKGKAAAKPADPPTGAEDEDLAALERTAEAEVAAEAAKTSPPV